MLPFQIKGLTSPFASFQASFKASPAAYFNRRTHRLKSRHRGPTSGEGEEKRRKWDRKKSRERINRLKLKEN